MSKTDENRRRILKLAGASIAGFTLLYAEEGRELLFGGGDNNGDKNNDSVNTDTPASTPSPNEGGGSGVYSPELDEIEMTDRQMRGVAACLEQDGYDDLSKEVQGLVNDDGYEESQNNRYVWNKGDPFVETSVDSEGPYAEVEVTPEIYKAVEECWMEDN